MSPEIFENYGHRGMRIDECRDQADRIITLKGMCLLLLDRVGSKREPNRTIHQDFMHLLQQIELNHPQYFPANNLATLSRTDQGFIHFGDAAVAGITDSIIIDEVATKTYENNPRITLHYGVAVDGYDREALCVIR